MELMLVLEQFHLIFTVHVNHQGILLEGRIWFSRSGTGKAQGGFCISHKIPGDVYAVDTQTTICGRTLATHQNPLMSFSKSP